MAFAIKYKAEINDKDNTTVIVSVQEDGWTGTAESFSIDASNSIRISHEGDPYNKHTYILPSRAEVVFYTNDNWDMHELLYSTDRQHKLVIQVGSTIEFEGWIVSGVQSENYSLGPYGISLVATCGLADLKNIPYLNSGALYDTYQTVLEIIQNCLAKVGSNYSVFENSDIFATTGMTTTPITDYSPLNQSNTHTRAYGNSIEDVLSCWEVLEKVAQAAHCRLFRHTRLDGGGGSAWILSKLNKLGSTETYRKISGGSVSGGLSVAPLLTIETDLERIGNGGGISIKQAYKEINLITQRTSDFSLLSGKNFGGEDFASSSSLNKWGTIDRARWVGPFWGSATVTKEEIGENTVVALSDYVAQHNSALAGDASIDNGSGKVRINDTGTPLTTADYILIENPDYQGMYKVTAKSTNYFDISADYISDQNIRWRTINGLKGLEYKSILALDPNHVVVDSEQHLKVSVEYEIEEHLAADTWGFVTVVVLAYITSTNQKVLNNEGRWIDYSANSFFPIIDTWDSVYLNRIPFKQNKKISVIGDLSSSNNFYTSGSPKFYIALYNTNYTTTATKLVKWKSVKVSILFGSEKVNTTVIDSDFVESLDLEMFHADGDGGDNDEFRFLNPISDDSTPKQFINSWQQDGATANNLEDIIEANLAASYAANSQIWEGSLEGDLNIMNAIKDPFNFNRIFQIQSLNRNILNKISQVSMIEITPNKSYYIELVSSSSGDKYSLSSSYGDITLLFLDLNQFEMSILRRKTDGTIAEAGGLRTLDGDSVYSGGRTVMTLLDADFQGTIGTSLEVKGVLKKV